MSHPDLVLARMERVWSQPAPSTQVGELAAVAVDMVRSRRELVLQNAVLRTKSMFCDGSKRRKLHLSDRLKPLLGCACSVGKFSKEPVDA